MLVDSKDFFQSLLLAFNDAIKLSTQLLYQYFITV